MRGAVSPIGHAFASLPLAVRAPGRVYPGGGAEQAGNPFTPCSPCPSGAVPAWAKLVTEPVRDGLLGHPGGPVRRSWSRAKREPCHW